MAPLIEEILNYLRESIIIFVQLRENSKKNLLDLIDQSLIDEEKRRELGELTRSLAL